MLTKEVDSKDGDLVAGPFNKIVAAIGGGGRQRDPAGSIRSIRARTTRTAPGRDGGGGAKKRHPPESATAEGGRRIGTFQELTKSWVFQKGTLPEDELPDIGDDPQYWQTEAEILLREHGRDCRTLLDILFSLPQAEQINAVIGNVYAKVDESKDSWGVHDGDRRKAMATLMSCSGGLYDASHLPLYFRERTFALTVLQKLCHNFKNNAAMLSPQEASSISEGLLMLAEAYSAFYFMPPPVDMDRSGESLPKLKSFDAAKMLTTLTGLRMPYSLMVIFKHPIVRSYYMFDKSQANVGPFMEDKCRQLIKFCVVGCRNIMPPDYKLPRSTSNGVWASGLLLAEPIEAKLRELKFYDNADAAGTTTSVVEKRVLAEVIELLTDILGVEPHQYGSSVTGLKCEGSDFDLGIMLQDCLRSSKVREHWSTDITALDIKRIDQACDESRYAEFAVKVIRLLGKGLSQKPLLRKKFRYTLITGAKKPLITITHISSDINIDVCVCANVIGRCNSALLQNYGRLDSRFPQLAVLVKSWSKARQVNGAYNSNLSSYAITLTVIDFLIRRRVLPNIQVPTRVAQDDLVHGWLSRYVVEERGFVVFNERMGEDPTCHYSSVPWRSWRSENEQTVGQLLRDYFQYMLFEFDWNAEIVSPRCSPAALDKTRLFIDNNRVNSGPPTPNKLSKKESRALSSKKIDAENFVKASDRKLREFCAQNSTRSTLDDWMYKNALHSCRRIVQMARYHDNFYNLTVECPTESERFLQPTHRAGIHLYLECMRAWCILMHSSVGTTSLDVLYRPIPPQALKRHSFSHWSRSYRIQTWHKMSERLAADHCGMPMVVCADNRSGVQGQCGTALNPELIDFIAVELPGMELTTGLPSVGGGADGEEDSLVESGSPRAGMDPSLSDEEIDDPALPPEQSDEAQAGPEDGPPFDEVASCTNWGFENDSSTTSTNDMQAVLERGLLRLYQETQVEGELRINAWVTADRVVWHHSPE